MSREELVRTYRDTQRMSKQISSSYKQSVKYSAEELPTYEEIVSNPDLWDGEDREGTLTILNEDTLDAAYPYRDEHTLVLNMASEGRPGGGVKKGSRAQEEELFRRTNYCDCTNRSFYPIDVDEFIVTEGVVVLKDSDYQPLRDQHTFDFMAMPAVRRPSLEGGVDYLDEEDRETMEQKIDLIFRYGVLEKYDTLVLGALGCGAFRNPPEQVALMFKAALEKYRKFFDNIVFAVLSTGNNENYDIFSQVLK